MCSPKVNKENVSIGCATENDCTGILECLAAAFEPYRGEYTPGGYLDTVLAADTVRTRMEQMMVLVAKDAGGRVVGTIACQAVGEGEGHLRGMAVLPDWSGSGIAQRLLVAAEDELQKAGCQRVTLDTTEPLKRAIRFYEKNGYRATGRVQDFFGMPLYEYSKTFSS